MGPGNYVGGIFGRIDCKNYQNAVPTKQITIETSNIIGNGDYVGGIVGHGRTEEVMAQNNTVKGRSYVGGVSGYGHIYWLGTVRSRFRLQD